MLIGEYKHTLDAKKRVAVPARFRKELGRGVVVTHGFDKCLFVYSKENWQKLASKLATLPVGKRTTRGLNRFIFGGAVLSDIDSLGRILIPDFLRSFADLKTKVVIVGVHERLEIWDEKHWQAYKGRVTNQADTFAEKLGELGTF